MRFLRLSPPLILAIAALTGCRTGDVAQVIHVAGGGTITVPLTREGMKPGEADGYRIAQAIFEPEKDKREGFYLFGMIADHEPALKHIKIEDISDDTAVTLVDVADPKFIDRKWLTHSQVLSVDDPPLQWTQQIPASIRVYKVTLTKNDGSVVTFNHLAYYPPYLKTLLRSRWGEKY